MDHIRTTKHGNEVVVSLESVFKTYDVGSQKVEVLKNVGFTIEEGEFVIIVGPSGSGKSTVLYTLLGLEQPTSGSVTVLGQNLYSGYDEDLRSDFRKKHIGMVYQQANWVKALNVVENVAFPVILAGEDKLSARNKAMEKLKAVEIDGWAEYYPTELSGGQQQRVAIARALVNNPKIIVADEPTGNLDHESGEKVMNVLKALSTNENKTMIMVTHDLDYLQYADKAVRIFDGSVGGIYGKDHYKDLLMDIRSKGVPRSKQEETAVNTKI